MKKIAVIGAGASGLAAAITAARLGAEVVVFEKKDTPGKKILATGNGRCNFINEDQERRHFHSSDRDKTSAILDGLSFEDICAFFKEMGILPYSINGYMYPMSLQAQSVHNALVETAKELGVKLTCNSEVTSIREAVNGIYVSCLGKKELFDKVIVSVGTNAGSKEGVESSELLLKPLGHSFISFKPALCAIRLSTKLCSYWKGVRVRGRASLYIDEQPAASDKGELMLTDYGISGIPVFQLSYLVPEAIECNRKVWLSCDFVPELNNNELYFFLSDISKKYPDKNISSLLYGIMPKKLADSLVIEILKSSEKYAHFKAHEISWEFIDEELKDYIVKGLKSMRFKVTGTNEISSSQVCSGGVRLEEIDNNCQSKKSEKVYLTGELLDVNGDCGGYNLQWAFTTGILAGRNAAV